MAIIASYNYGDISIKDAYIKITSIWGNKLDGWCAWVDATDSEEESNLSTTFHVSCQYNDGENPFTGLYLAMDKLPFLSNVIHDVKQKKRSKKS